MKPAFTLDWEKSKKGIVKVGWLRGFNGRLTQGASCLFVWNSKRKPGEQIHTGH
jgi:hypothetical protein